MVSLVASILPLVSLFQVFDGLSAITSGIVRAIGKQFTGALLNLSAYYLIGGSSCPYLSSRLVRFQFATDTWSFDLIRHSVRDLARVLARYAAAWPMGRPDRVSHLCCRYRRVDMLEDGLGPRGAEGPDPT